MAKRSRGSGRANKAAEQLGRLLGQVAARVDAWKAQREAIREDLTKIVATANDLRAELGTAGRTGRRAARQAKVTISRAGRRITAQARRRMSAAAKRRWAAFRAAKAKQQRKAKAKA